MVTAQSLLLATMLSATSAVELVEFTAPWCEPCRHMQPVVRQLQADGIPVRQIQIDDHRDLARQCGVDSIPCFLAVVNGQIVGRRAGEASGQELRELFAAAQRTAEAAEPAQRPRTAVSRAAATTGPSSATTAQAADPVAALCLAASVRLRVEDPQGISLGTGTVIDLHGDEALVLTCGHIFRDSAGQGQIRCDFLGDNGPQQVPGRVVSYDLRRDIGLVSVVTSGEVRAVPLAGAGYRPQEGEAVFSVGCNHGQEPTLIHNRVLAINRYHGPANLVVGGRPVDGRSGGGLFTRDGRLIGVCNAADAERDEGLYAALGPVHAELDRAGLAFIYRGETPALSAIAQQMAAGPAAREHDDSSARVLPGAADPPRGLAAPPGELADELICIVRSRQAAAADRVLIVADPSPELLRQLHQELAQPSAAAAHQIYRRLDGTVPGESAISLAAPSARVGWRSQAAAAN